MTRREYLYRHSHWRLEPIHGISLTVLIQVGLIPAVHVPLWHIDARRREADAKDERATVEGVRYE